MISEEFVAKSTDTHDPFQHAPPPTTAFPGRRNRDLRLSLAFLSSDREG